VCVCIFISFFPGTNISKSKVPVLKVPLITEKQLLTQKVGLSKFQPVKCANNVSLLMETKNKNKKLETLRVGTAQIWHSGKPVDMMNQDCLPTKIKLDFRNTTKEAR
jgi:hypothetical protein